MTTLTQNASLGSLDQLIAHLGGTDMANQSQGPCNLLLEHLQAARRDLMGSMAGEYRSSLQYAHDSISCIPDKVFRGETKKLLQGLIDSTAAKAPTVAAA